VEIPEITLPVGPGRNLSVLVEAAVRNHILCMKGYDASQAFIERQKQRLETLSR
jgi:HPr kinase/phosphorylase